MKTMLFHICGQNVKNGYNLLHLKHFHHLKQVLKDIQLI